MLKRKVRLKRGFLDQLRSPTRIPGQSGGKALRRALMALDKRAEGVLAAQPGKLYQLSISVSFQNGLPWVRHMILVADSGKKVTRICIVFILFLTGANTVYTTAASSEATSYLPIRTGLRLNYLPGLNPSKAGRILRALPVY